MSRIRSLHPEQWTDAEFVSCSPLARLLALGVRNEADDNGVFEWKPLVLKMRLLPGDNCDAAVLLEELIATKQVVRFCADGREYGAVRNFTRFQRPKKPHYRYPEPPTGTEPVPHRSGNPPADVTVAVTVLPPIPPVKQEEAKAHELPSKEVIKNHVDQALSALRGKRPHSTPQPDWDDPANRKARWQQKMQAELFNRLTPPNAEAIWAGYLAGDPKAIAFIETVDRSIRQRRASAA